MKPVYEIKHGEPNSPLYDVWKDGVKHQAFTSHSAARAWLDHVLEHGEQTRLKPVDKLNGFFK